MSGTDVLEVDRIPVRFRPALRRVQQLETVAQYEAAYVFGSVARDDADARDLDVHVVAADGPACASINHPVINGVKLDLSFLSFRQLAARTEREIEKGERVPMVAESTIVFDKTGELTRLRASAREAAPRICAPTDQQAIQFLLYFLNDKAERFLATDPSSALFAMHTGVGEVLNAHYQLQRRWRLSSKRVLADLRGWDPALVSLVEHFVGTADVPEKFGVWAQIIDYVLIPLGGRQAVGDMNCACAVCRDNLTMLAEA